MWMQGSTYSQPRHYVQVGWLVLRSAAFTPGEIPQYSFYRRLSEPQGQSGHEGVKKNLHSSYTRDRTRAVQPVAKRLAAWATWLARLRYLENHIEAVALFLMNWHLIRLNVDWISVVNLSVNSWMIDLSGELSYVMKNWAITATLVPRSSDSGPVILPKS